MVGKPFCSSLQFQKPETEVLDDSYKISGEFFAEILPFLKSVLFGSSIIQDIEILSDNLKYVSKY